VVLVGCGFCWPVLFLYPAVFTRSRVKNGTFASCTVEERTRKVQKALKIVKEPISLETPIGDEEESSLGDFVEDKLAPSPVEAAIRGNFGEQTRKVLATLTPREEQILRMRFGIGQKTDYTLEEVGKQFAVTRERIRQIEAKALRKLRQTAHSRNLGGFVEREFDCLLLLRCHVDKGHRPAGDIGHIAIPLLNCLPLYQGWRQRSVE
jgi:RNA polymerase sigma factor (sigma-70 family)